MNSDYFPIHAHSEYSVLDGMGTIEDMVTTVAAHGQPGMALTDHGNMSGALRLYKQCKQHGLAAFPGSEFYVIKDWDTKDRRFHLGIVALDYEGFKALIRLSSRSHQRDRFYRKPLIDVADLAELGKDYGQHVAVTTGCYYGLVVQALLEGQHLPTLNMLRKFFPNLYVEIQYHGIDTHEGGWTDRAISVELFKAADSLSLPVVLGQDSHYCDASHQPAHDLMKDICYFGDGEDNRFPGGPYHLASVKELRSRFNTKRWEQIEDGHSDLLDKNRLSLPALDSYKFYVPQVHKRPERELERLVAQATDLSWPDATIVRIGTELDVINHMGMANYFLLVKEVTDWCRANGVIVNARGSVNGSMVCYLLGITTVDPMQWGTDFSRFLSPLRKKPPDIDLDVESGRRMDLIDHLRKKHPNLVHIGTFQRIGITEQEGDDGIGEDRGSIFVQYMAAMKRKDPTFDGHVRQEDRKPLNQLADIPVRKSIGVHAAGIVLPTLDHPVDDYLATGLVVSSSTIVTQSVMEDVEDAGYVKMDVLGIRALETLSQAQRNMGRDPNDWSWIPWDDREACKLLRSGRTVGVFQFSGLSTMHGGREMKVKSTMDAIICLALYRPALMAGGQKDHYLANRGHPRSQQHRLHKVFDDILDVTDGVAVFQEQVMEMCQTIGMSYDDWNDLMKAVKASNDKIGQYAVGIMSRIEPIFFNLCLNVPMTMEEAERAWDTVTGFTDYGFNRAHATSYGIMSYRAAYLKAHHPLEYMHALLSVWAGTTSEQKYTAEARRLGIQIARPDVNTSDVLWSIDRTRKAPTLRKGLLSIHGVGLKAAQAVVDARPAGGWPTMDDFVAGVPAQPVNGGKSWAKNGTLIGVMERLRAAGALKALGLDND